MFQIKMGLQLQMIELIYVIYRNRVTHQLYCHWAILSGRLYCWIVDVKML